MAKICSSADVLGIVDEIFEKVTANSSAITLRQEGKIIHIDTKNAKDPRLVDPHQAVAVARQIRAKLFKELSSVLPTDLIKQHENRLFTINSDYSKKGIAMVRKTIPKKLLQQVDAMLDQEQTLEEIVQEKQNKDAQEERDFIEQRERENREQLGITEAEHQTFLDANIDVFTMTEGQMGVQNAEAFQVIPDSTDSDIADMNDTAGLSFAAVGSPVVAMNNLKFDKFLQLKKNQAYRLQRDINQIRKLKTEHREDADVLKDLTKMEETLLKRLEGEEGKKNGVKDDVTEMTENPTYSRILFAATADMERVKSLSASDNTNDLDEAREIVEFYEAGANFTNNPNLPANPFFSVDDLMDLTTGKPNIPQDVMDALSDIYETLRPYASQIYTRQRQIVVQNIGSLKQIRSNTELIDAQSGKISYESIFYSKEGLPDVGGIEGIFFDPSTNFLSDNGVVPHAMQIILNNAYNEALTFSKQTTEKVDGLMPNLTKALQDLGENSSILGKNVGVSFDIFRAKSSDGLLRDGIVQRYTGEFFDAFKKISGVFRETLNFASDPSLDPVIAAKYTQQAFQDRQDWIRKNTVLINPSLLPEVQVAFPNSGFTFTDDGGIHAQELKDLLNTGTEEYGYKEEVEKQIAKIREYEAALSVEKERLSALGVGLAYPSKMQQFVNRNSPFIAATHFYNNTTPSRGVLSDFPYLRYSYMIPRNIEGYYDQNFSKIEGNKDLKEFHSIVLEAIERIQEMLPPELRKQLDTTSLPQLRKPLMEIFSDSDLTLKAKISEVYGKFIEFLRSLYSINPETGHSNNLVDTLTGAKLQQVNSDFLNGAKGIIEEKVKTLTDQYLSVVGKGLAKNLKIADETSWNALPSRLKSFLENEIHPAIIQGFKNDPNKAFSVKGIIKESVTNDVISEGSFDLPKIVKLYTHLAMEYGARSKVLPALKLMKEHFNMIQNPELTSQDNRKTNNKTDTPILKGQRAEAIKQMESWFNRAVLGNFEKRNEFGSTKSTVRDTFSKEDKAKATEYDTILEELKSEFDGTKDKKEKSNLGKKIARYENLKDNLGKKISWTAFIDANFSYLRVMGLGWNIKSQLTNLFEGQTSNMTLGASGTYFSYENIERANNIVMGSFLKNLSFGKVSTSGAKKASAIMAKYNLMQDATNILQKASNKTPLDNVNKLFAPYELTKRVEYMNQTPVVLSILMDQEISDMNGNISNVWDAMDSSGKLKNQFALYTDGKKVLPRDKVPMNGEFMDEAWAPTENVANWENTTGEAYNSFASTTEAALVYLHGDYSDLRGNSAAETLTGTAALMFKKWSTMWIHSRLAIETVDIRTKSSGKSKGRFRSFTGATGALSGGIFGATAAPTAISAVTSMLGVAAIPVLLPILGGAAFGYIASKRFGMNSKGKTQRQREALGVTSAIGEAALTLKLISLKMVGIPLNAASNAFIGHSVINHNPMLPGDSNPNSSVSVDARNYRANIAELAIQLSLLSMAILVRVAWGDDEKDKKKYSFFSNQLGKLILQTEQIFSISQMHEFATDFAALRYLTNVVDLTDEILRYMTLEEKRTVGKGSYHEGELKIKNKARKFLPSILRDDKLGFAGEMHELYPFNEIGIIGKGKSQSEEKKAQEFLKDTKKDLIKEMITSQNLSEEEATDRKKMIDKLLSKPKGATYQQLRDNIQEYLDILSMAYSKGGDPELLEDMPSRREVEEDFDLDANIYPDEEGSEEEEPEEKGESE